MWPFNIIKNCLSSSPVIPPPTIVADLPVTPSILCSPANPNWNYIIHKAKIRSADMNAVLSVCTRIRANIIIYKLIEQAIGMPWYLIAGIHYRESNLNFDTCLHNGDPLPGPTVHVPKGRGPFKTWSEAATDALLMDQYRFPKEWDVENAISFAFHYNGTGYTKTGIYSPYICSGTDFYSTGKFKSDGKFDISEMDRQLGLIPIFNSLGML